MTRRKTTQRLIILSAMISAGIVTGAGLANAANETGQTQSRMEMIIKKLMPQGNNANTENSSNLVRRLVMSQDGIGQQNVLVNQKHSLDLSVLFEPGSDALTDKARDLLTDLAAALEADSLSKATYLIGGHTDANGDAEKNRILSERRARAVKSYLVNTFEIDPARLATAGYGEKRLADTDNPDAQINRRIEVSLISTGYSVPKKRIAKTATARVQPTSARSDYSNKDRFDQYSFGTEQLRPMPVGYRIDRRFDDYNSDIFNPPTITGMYATARTGNTVCDSFEGLLTDPRPLHMELDDYDARTPATCPTANGYRASYKDGGFGQFSPEDDNELLK